MGIDWTVRSTLINQFHAGYMYQYSAFVIENKGIDLTKNWVRAVKFGIRRPDT